MKEIDIRQEVYHLLHTHLDLWPITQTDMSICWKCHTRIKPPIGRPDILVMNPLGRSIVVEVKAFRGSSFAFDLISDEQRQWLDNWLDAGGFGYLALGTLERPRRLWIVDWDAWSAAEALIRPHQSSIPLVAGKGFKLVLQRNHWDAHTLLADYELAKVPYSWDLPQAHTIRRIVDGDCSSLQGGSADVLRPGQDTATLDDH